MESSTSSNASPSKAPTRSRKKLFLAVGIIGIIAVIVILLIANAMIQNQPTADFQASWSIDQDLSGPTTFTVHVSNNGSAYGSTTLVCYVNNGVGMYSNSQTVALNAGGSTTVTLVVPTEYGTMVTRSMCTVYFEF